MWDQPRRNFSLQEDTTNETNRQVRSKDDQVLDDLSVGPIPRGTNKFIFQAKSPDSSKIPNDQVLGVTVILLTCAYDGREFIRIGYYVNNEYIDASLIDNPPDKPIIEKIRRNILDKPRETRFAIKWYHILSLLKRGANLT